MTLRREGDLRLRANRSVMADLTAKRTLVKSPPELWEELSEVDRLAKHLDAFGEIRITKLEPEHTVAWEGEHASGTVSIEPSGWGTKVTLTAELPEQEAPPEPEPVAQVPEPEPVPEEPEPEPPVAEAPPVAEEPPAPRRKRGFWGWLFRERTAPPVPVQAEPEPEPVPEPEPEPSRSNRSPSSCRPTRSRSNRSPLSESSPRTPRRRSTACSTRSARRITAPSRAADPGAPPWSSARV